MCWIVCLCFERSGGKYWQKNWTFFIFSLLKRSHYILIFYFFFVKLWWKMWVWRNWPFYCWSSTDGHDIPPNSTLISMQSIFSLFELIGKISVALLLDFCLHFLLLCKKVLFFFGFHWVCFFLVGLSLKYFSICNAWIFLDLLNIFQVSAAWLWSWVH